MTSYLCIKMITISPRGPPNLSNILIRELTILDFLHCIVRSLKYIGNRFLRPFENDHKSQMNLQCGGSKRRSSILRVDFGNYVTNWTNKGFRLLRETEQNVLNLMGYSVSV